MTKKWNVGILLFNDVEVLDFAGPFEVFSITTRPDQSEKPFQVHVISIDGQIVKARNGLLVTPQYSLDNAPKLDILIIPGGYGAREIEMNDEKTIDWIRKQSNVVNLLASVCTGSFLLAKAGLLDGKKATSHWMEIERLEKQYPQLTVQHDVKYVDEGSIITSAGISAGLNMSFHIVKKLLGADVAKDTAKRMEYDIIISD
jgi:transcriptional regulator GlxA family with amidase domain